MNRHAVRLAREVAQEGGALVAGNVCNTWAYDPADPATSATVRAQYTEQLGWAVDEGVDFVISETNDFPGEALIALEVPQELGLPAMVTLASTQPGTTRDGYDYRLPAWGTALGSRVTKHPKVHLIDSGVMAWLLSLTPQKIAQDAPAALTEYGHLLETFAVGEMLKQASWSDAPVTAGRFRTEAGDEVDLVLERDDGQVIAVEVKAGSRISGEDFRGLRQLKERLGPRLEEAIILHTGEHAYTHDDWITILPLDRLWRASAIPMGAW